MSRYCPQLARSSQPLRRSDSMTWSAALGPSPSSLIMSIRATSRRPLSLRASTTRLSCGDSVRVVNSMFFSFTKHPKTGGFDEDYSDLSFTCQAYIHTKPPSQGGFVYDKCTFEFGCDVTSSTPVIVFALRVGYRSL